MRRIDLGTLRAAAWTLLALRQTRRELRARGPDAVRLKVPKALPRGAERGVRAMLRRAPATCLERALVLQAWLAAHGDRRDVVIGVAAPASGFAAHAWVDRERDPSSAGFDELTRLPAA